MHYFSVTERKFSINLRKKHCTVYIIFLKYMNFSIHFFFIYFQTDQNVEKNNFHFICFI